LSPDPKDVPLNQFDGIFCGSAAILETGPFGAVEHSVTRIKTVVQTHIPDRLVKGLRPGERKIGAMSPFRSQLSAYSVFDCIRAVWFVGDGDCDAARDLLEDAAAIGAMTSVGYGRATGRKLFDIPNALTPGIRLEDGRPTRAVPLSVWEKLGFEKHVRATISETRFRPPYWQGEIAVCIAPACHDLYGTMAEIKYSIGSG
jgi:hypothetical protein